MQNKTNWIWLPEWTAEDDSDTRIIYFRRVFDIEGDAVPKSMRIRVSADSRYKLYVNGLFVQEGPQKALDLREWFCDEADIAPFIHGGRNVIAAEVLRYPAPDFSASCPNSNDSLYRTELPGLHVEGGVTAKEAKTFPDRAPGTVGNAR